MIRARSAEPADLSEAERYVRDWLGWSGEEAQATVGAYPVR